MKKAGLMSTLGSTLGTVETLMNEATTFVDVLSSYNTNWSENRQLELAKSRFERDVEWMQLGKAILSTQFDTDAIKAAKDRYLNDK